MVPEAENYLQYLECETESLPQLTLPSHRSRDKTSMARNKITKWNGIRSALNPFVSKIYFPNNKKNSQNIKYTSLKISEDKPHVWISDLYRRLEKSRNVNGNVNEKEQDHQHSGFLELMCTSLSHFSNIKELFKLKIKEKKALIYNTQAFFLITEQFPYNESEQSEVNSAILCASTQCDHIDHIEIHRCIQYCRNWSDSAIPNEPV